MEFKEDIYDYYFLFIEKDIHGCLLFIMNFTSLLLKSNSWTNHFSELFYLITMFLINKKISMFIILF